MPEPLKGFRELWTRSMVGFLAEAGPGDVLPFNPELLSPLYHYAREFPGADGVRREESDRWTEALALVDMAKACWAEAEARHAHG
jgi:hypothetical protein